MLGHTNIDIVDIIVYIVDIIVDILYVIVGIVDMIVDIVDIIVNIVDIIVDIVDILVDIFVDIPGVHSDKVIIRLLGHLLPLDFECFHEEAAVHSLAGGHGVD